MIAGDRVRLRSIEEEDLPRFVAWFNDPEIIHGLRQFLPMSLREERQWFEDLLNRDPIERPFAIDINSDGEWVHVGSCGFMDFNHQARRAEFGIMIGEKKYWGQGYGTEATCLMLDLGFDTLNLERIGLCVFEDNKRAIQVYENLGFVQEGKLRKHEYHNGEYFDTIMMGILRKEWQEGSKRECANG